MLVFRSADELGELATLGQPYIATLDSNPAILHAPLSERPSPMASSVA
jgi:hypothetical protein